MNRKTQPNTETFIWLIYVMTPFTLKEEKISQKTNLKILTKLYFLQLKKNISWLQSFKLVLPVLVLVFVVTGFIWLTQTTTTNPSEKTLSQTNVLETQNHFSKEELKKVRADKYRIRAKNRAQSKKIRKYTQLTMLRTASMR